VGGGGRRRMNGQLSEVASDRPDKKKKTDLKGLGDEEERENQPVDFPQKTLVLSGSLRGERQAHEGCQRRRSNGQANRNRGLRSSPCASISRTLQSRRFLPRPPLPEARAGSLGEQSLPSLPCRMRSTRRRRCRSLDGLKPEGDSRSTC
jgi:hypothetical protein